LKSNYLFLTQVAGFCQNEIFIGVKTGHSSIILDGYSKGHCNQLIINICIFGFDL